MQRCLSFLLMFFSVSLLACAETPVQPVGVFAAPVSNRIPEVSVKAESLPEVTLSPLTRSEAPAPADVNAPAIPPGNAHIALLLPLKSPAFGRAAEVLKQGFMAAAAVQSGALPVIVYPSSDRTEDILATYLQATQAGASVVVGPLTRNGVSALAASTAVSVPTLALNQPEGKAEYLPNFYVFGVAAEQEARQVARLAFGEGRTHAVVITSDSLLSRRLQQAFGSEWTALGGPAAKQLIFNGSNHKEIGSAIGRQGPEVLFLAMSSRDALLLGPFLNHEIPTYATSQVYAGSGNLQKYHDLNGVQFVDMPWLLQPDHIAVMVYPRPPAPLPVDMERLYALGIDAWRLALQLQASQPGVPFSLDGVTGQLTLDVRTNLINREGVRAEFGAGEALLLMP